MLGERKEPSKYNEFRSVIVDIRENKPSHEKQSLQVHMNAVDLLEKRLFSP